MGDTAVRMRCRVGGTSRGGPGGRSPARPGPDGGGFPGAGATCTAVRAAENDLLSARVQKGPALPTQEGFTSFSDVFGITSGQR